MAPPSNRRSGYSRRAQYTTFFSYIAAVVGAVVGAGFLILSIVNPGAFSGMRGVSSDATAPAGQVTAVTRSGSLSLVDTIGGYFAAGRKNAKLQRELDEAKVRLVEASAIAEENARLKALLALTEGERKAVAVARLIASTPTSTRRLATISAGSREGVTPGMPVRSPLGLVGRVLEVSHTTSRLLLVTDSQSVVPVRRASDGVPAFAQGRGDGTLQLRLINLGINPLKRGDSFVTSGSGGLYHPGTAIAVVTSLTRDGAIARVLSDPSASEFVIVEPTWSPPAKSEAAPAPAAGDTPPP